MPKLCQSYDNASLFLDPDIEPYPHDWKEADATGKFVMAVKKQFKEKACVAICSECPFLMECREELEASTLPVYGVVAATTPAQRGNRSLVDVYIGNHLS